MRFIDTVYTFSERSLHVDEEALGRCELARSTLSLSVLRDLLLNVLNNEASPR
jgi:hypothetical protein